MLTKEQYTLLKQFPKDKSYVKRDKIKKMRNVIDVIKTCDELYRPERQLLNGDINGVGLRITDEGLQNIANISQNIKHLSLKNGVLLLE